MSQRKVMFQMIEIKNFCCYKTLNLRDQKLFTSFLGIDHHLEKVKQDAEIFSSGSDDMSSDDTDFNQDELEALSARVC